MQERHPEWRSHSYQTKSFGLFRLKKPPPIIDMSYYLTNENSFLNINNAHLKVSGNVHADVMKIGAVEFAPIASNVTTTTNFTNVETGLTTSSNLHVGGTLTMGTVEVIATTHNLENTTTNGNITPHTVEFTNATTSIVASGNVAVEKELTVSGNVAVSGVVGTSETGALTLPSGTTADQPSTGLVPGMLRFNTDLSDLEYYTSLESSSPVVTGGTVDTITGGENSTDTQDRYKIHTFTTGGVDLTVTSGPVLIEYLIIGGGGGGGADHGGGGGGGGYATGTMKLLNGTYPIVIGAGGTRGGGTAAGGSGAYIFPTNGGNSSAFGLTVYGGGYGGSRNYQSSGAKYGPPTLGGHGANGGGGAGTGYLISDTTTQGGMNKIYSNEWKPIFNDHSIQGNVGGYGTSGNNTTNAGNGGGGGGAGGGGQNSTGAASGAGKPGNGGVGKFSGITGNWVERAGGGGGGRWHSGSMSSASGGGGPGGGQNNLSQFSTSGTANTGGGGGGGSDGGGHGAQGGSGIVIVRYKV